jgi:uncharacterized integral membrane protein
MIMEDKPKRFLFRILLAIIIVILIVTFSLQNSDITDVRIIFWTASFPLVILFLMCFIAGIFLVLIGAAPIISHSKSKSRLIEQLKERIDFLEKENARLIK